MARTVAVVHVCVLLALCGTGVPMPTSCPMVTTPGYICTTSSNCTEMVCTITSNTTTLMSASTTIRVQRCDDPPMIDMQAQGMFMNGSSFNFSYQFQESGSVFNGGAFVGTSVQRNWTSLSFSAYIATQPFQYLIPEVTYPINTTQCLCDSMVELADKIRSPLEHDCAPTTDCDGVRCELDIIFTTSYMKVLVLSCAQPPALGVIVEDSNGNPSYSTVVNESSSGVVLFGALAVHLDVLLVHHDYSMDIQANLTYFSNGFEIVPLHTIHLDPNSCSTPPTVTPTNPPTPSSPPPDAPDLCITLYNIANSTANPLTCFVVSSCTALECELVSNNHLYEINMRFLPRENDVKAYMAVIERRIIWEVRPGNETREYDLEPQGRRLQFSVSATNNSLSLKLILQQDNQQNILIPETSITLPSAENCLSWVSIISQYPECSYLTDCQGILCFTYYGYIHRATLSVEKCADPVVAQLTLESERGIEFEGNITESTTFGFGWVTMERNDTHLSFSASALYDDIAAWLIPSVSIPLEPRACSCQSLKEWADTEPSPLQHDCATNDDCNGVRCELNVLGAVYHIENILLSCDDPPGIELLVEDVNNRPLYATIINHTGQYVVEFNSVQIPLYAIVEHHPYSIDVEGNIIIPSFGNITVVPPRKLLLDRTTCPIPPTILPTTPSPPITFPPTASPTCQSLGICTTSPSCTEMVCTITSNTTTLMSASTTIRVQRCDDPPMIDMQAQGMFMNGSSFNFSYQFQESGSVFNGGAFVGASVQRNWTSLGFSAYIATQYLIPEITYPINTTQCLCDSMVELADKIHSPLEHDCAPTTDCDGVRCELDIIFTTSYMEVLVLSCAQPPALGVIVEDSNGNPSYSTVVNESSSGVVLIGALAVRLDVLLVHHDYSMDIQANLTYFSNGFEIVPLHTIHLDPNSCSTPPTITPTNPPTPSSPPPDAPDLCITLYNIANSTANPLTCFVVSSCTTLECELVSNNHVYEINMRFLPRENDVKAYMAVIEQRIIWEVRPGNETREYDLEPQGRRLQFSVSATNNSLSLKLILQQDNQQNIIIPESSITLPSAENCLSWVSIISQHPECSYLTDCQGILCFTYYGYIHRATLSVEKCADPVIAQLTLESERGIEFEGNITESTTFGFGWVTMERNDTHLSFSASALYDDIAAWLIPSVSIPLEPRECSCQSLEEWADTEPSPLEHDCATNEDCNGVRCELNVFGTIYHIENILLSCDDPPGIELFVEDENNRPLYATVITHTGQYVVELNSVQIPLYAIVEHHPYSIDVEGNIIIPPFGNITVVPPRKLLLDRTTCPIPPTIFPTTPSPPITFPPTASPTCQSLIDIAKENAEEPFVCGILVDDGGDDCDTLQCHLDILASYSLTIELYPQGAEYVASVSVVVKEGKILADKVNVKEMFDVQLHEGLLTIVFELQGKTLGMLVEVTLESDTTTLINSTVPLKEKEKDEHSSSQKSRLGVQIGIPVVVVCVCVLAVIISIVVVVVWQRKRRAQQFEFKAMSYDLKTKSEQQASASRDATERDSYEPLQSSLQSDV